MLLKRMPKVLMAGIAANEINDIHTKFDMCIGWWVVL